MTVYVIDTNAGPVVRHRAASPAKCREYVERHVPLLRRRGYTSAWHRSGPWHVLDVFNSRGRQVHACAFMTERDWHRSTGR